MRHYNKAVRMSDWGRRPLTDAQVHYAALDAWVLVELHRRLSTEHAEEHARLSSGIVYSVGAASVSAAAAPTEET